MMYVPSDLFPYIHSYLVQCGLEKTVKRFTKEADYVPTHFDGPSLLDIFVEYNKSKINDSLGVKSGKKNKKLLKDAGLADLGKVQEKSDSSLCSTVKPLKRKRKLSIDEEIPCDNTTVDDYELSKPSKKRKKHAASPLPPINGDIENTNNEEKLVKNVTATTDSTNETNETTKQLSSSDDDNDDEDSNNNSDTDNNAIGNDSSINIEDKTSSRSKKRKSNTGVQQHIVPFRRVNDDEEVDPGLINNSFEAKKGARGSWGEKANRDLKFTKGRSFRHEKTKKKRGSYKGGLIDTTSVNSFKFDSD